MTTAKAFYVEQKITAFTNSYRILAADNDNPGELAAYVRQKPFAFREQIEFFADEDRKQLLFTASADKVIDLGATYTVAATDGQIIARFQKQFQASLGRSTWHVLDEQQDKVLAIVAERSHPVAILRRVWGILPVVGEIPFPLRFHFDITLPDGQLVGEHTKLTWLRDHYRLALSKDALRVADERAWWAMAVMLDALQSR